MFKWFKKTEKKEVKDNRYLVRFVQHNDSSVILRTLYVSEYIQWVYEIQGTIPQKGTNIVLNGKVWDVEECWMWYDHVSLAEDKIIVQVYLKDTGCVI